MDSPISNEDLMKMTRGFYASCITPKYAIRKLLEIRSLEDVKYLAKAGRYMLNHLKDFKWMRK